jgi:L-malate glycosyltransferase
VAADCSERRTGSRTSTEGESLMAQKHLRIGMVCYPTYGGSGAVATELGRLLARRGHTIHFISYARPFRLINDFHPNIFHHEISSEYHSLFPGQLYTISAAVKIHEIIEKIGLDVLHLHYALPHAVSAWLANEMLPPDRRVPTLTTLHGTDITLVGSKPAFHAAVKLGLDRSAGLTCVSQWLSRRTCKLFDTCEMLKTIYNFVDPSVFKPVPGSHARSYFAAPDEKILMHISNFRPVKRVKDVVRIFGIISQRIPARLIMIGDGPDHEQAVAEAEKLGIAQRVMMLGRQPAVENFLPLADLFLFPSDGESFGLAALEAMACQAPVVGARAGGLPEVVTEGECGLLCEVGDVEGMAEAGLRILTDEQMGRAWGEAVRRRAVEQFASERIVPQYEAAYEELLDHSSKRPKDRRK